MSDGRLHRTLTRLLPMPGSLRYQLLIRSLLVLAALFVLVGALQYLFIQDFLYRNKAESLRAQLFALPPDLMMGRGDDTGRRPGRIRSESPLLFQPGFSLVFIDELGQATAVGEDSDHQWNNGSPPLFSKEEYDDIRQQLRSRNRAEYRLIDTEQGEQLAVFRLAGIGGSRDPELIQAAVETESLRSQLLAQVGIFAGLALCAGVAGLALYLALLRRTLAPLSRIAQAAELTDSGNLHARLPGPQGQAEIDSLSEAFNGMLERLNDSFVLERAMNERMRRFIADASHELRTPLTSIQGFIDVLQRGAATKPEQLQRALASMKSESERVNKLVEDLLQLAKLDQTPSLTLEATNLSALLTAMEPQLLVLAGSRKLYCSYEEGAMARVNPDKLKQVILNLFHNAVQHTDPVTGCIQLRLRTVDEQILMLCKDNGSGISPEHLPHIFERFFRSDHSRTRSTGGTGLGLAITRSIIEAHHGRIEVASKPGEGSCFTVILPAARG
ncbi:ATP-binding protein [Paenibacillus sp. PL2-23]|uniref:sensor histidine kinase n=1 Tax=Paenibacillus sp. PL2-23 TaxID=2100729 RepID=UPI0030F4DEF2